MWMIPVGSISTGAVLCFLLASNWSSNLAASKPRRSAGSTAAEIVGSSDSASIMSSSHATTATCSGTATPAAAHARVKFDPAGNARAVERVYDELLGLGAESREAERVPVAV